MDAQHFLGLNGGLPSLLGDNVETQPWDIEVAPTPDPTPVRPKSFDGPDLKRAKYQGKPAVPSTATMELPGNVPSPPATGAEVLPAESLNDRDGDDGMAEDKSAVDKVLRERGQTFFPL